MAGTINISGTAIPRLSFGLGSLMKWAPGHTHPIPTDNSAEVLHAIDAGFRHFNTGDLYTNTDSLGEALRRSNLKRSEFTIALKLNTYAAMGCRGREHMTENVHKIIEKLGLEGYVDVVQLHFPPRGYVGNMTNREAWGVLEDLKDQGIARVIGVSNWTLADYQDLTSGNDLKHRPQLNENEFNPFLLSDPASQELRAYEQEHGIVHMNYGFLTAISGRLPVGSTALVQKLEEQSKLQGLSTAELLLSWAYYRLDGIVVTSSSNAERLRRTVQILSSQDPPVDGGVFDEIEDAAKHDGAEGKKFYGHPHMEKARLATAKAQGGS